MPDVLDALTEALLPRLQQMQGRQAGVKHNASGTPISFGYSHGPGGNLSFPGVDPAVFHTVLGAMSMLGQLPATPSVDMNPTYETITGVTADTGSEKTTVCANAPTAGLMKSCITTSVFGRYERATAEIELNRLGQRNDRADPMDLQLIGSPIDGTGIFSSGGMNPGAPGDVLTNEVARKFWERNVSLHRLLSRQLWTGNPDNNQSSGSYREMTSFSILVNTGYVDVQNNATCPAVDSYVDNVNFARIDTNADFIISRMTNMYYQLKDRADRMGMSPVRWVIAMRPQMFYELSAAWPCSYLTTKCQVSGNEQLNVDARDQIRFRDEMRSGKYLLIDGDRIEVVVDDGIAELDGNESGSFPRGCFASDIYFIPMSVVGGRAVTYLEYFQYQNPSISEALGNMVLGRVEGAFLTWPRQTNQCLVWQTKVEPRLVMRTPWLAGRLQNVVNCPVQHTRDAFPNEPYFANGGVQARPGPSYFTPWANS